VIEIMRKQTSPQMMAALWNKRFPNQIPDIVLPEQFNGDTLTLEGHELVVVDVGHTDTDDCTCLHVPSADLVVAGDIAYNDVHQYFAESVTQQKRMEWVAALDRVEALKPKVVIAGHKRESNSDSPKIIDETRQYIFDFDRLVDRTSTTEELYVAMLSLYPERINRGALWGAARAVKG
jgi:glyoxylase-like metal-dependent hydrolase (beta-lactamase superfamily II)